MSAIKAGDLVMVAYPTPCGCTHKIGATFRVTSTTPKEMNYCVNCGTLLPLSNCALGYSEDYAFRFDRLIKLDDPHQPETVERDTEIPHELA